LLLVQLQKDITTIRAASIETIAGLRSLKGMNNIIGSKARLKDLEQTTNGALTLLAVDQGSMGLYYIKNGVGGERNAIKIFY